MNLNSCVNYAHFRKSGHILFNRLLSKVLLNKSGLVRAKAGSFTLKTLNGCFSNYYQVRTWPVFAGTVTILEYYTQLNTSSYRGACNKS